MANREYELYLQKEDVKQEIRRELKIKEGDSTYSNYENLLFSILSGSDTIISVIFLNFATGSNGTMPIVHQINPSFISRC